MKRPVLEQPQPGGHRVPAVIAGQPGHPEIVAAAGRHRHHPDVLYGGAAAVVQLVEVSLARKAGTARFREVNLVDHQLGSEV